MVMPERILQLRHFTARLRIHHLTCTLIVFTVLRSHSAAAQGPGWLLGEPDDCQRKDVASNPQQHSFWKEAAPVALYKHVLLNLTTLQKPFNSDINAHIGPHGPGHHRQRRVEVQRSLVTGPELWQMDQDTPAFDPAFDTVCC